MKNSGFSLIEILIVLSIIGILLAFTVPSYSNHLLHKRRLAAEVALLHLAGQMETYYVQHHTYKGATFANLDTQEVIAQKSYRLAIRRQTASDFEVSAIPQGLQASHDLLCSTLTLNSRGIKRIAGTGTLNECW